MLITKAKISRCLMAAVDGAVIRLGVISGSCN